MQKASLISQKSMSEAFSPAFSRAIRLAGPVPHNGRIHPGKADRFDGGRGLIPFSWLFPWTHEDHGTGRGIEEEFRP
jgi:hypothetical protein